MKTNLIVPCYHGGAFFDAIGVEFDSLERRHDIINADVLDAWFPPSPKVIAALEDDLPWLLRTSPPTQCEGMARVIARTRGVLPENILPAAGSSDAIFLAFRQWLNPSSRVLILDPTYGEYAHVLKHVIGCRVIRLPLLRRDDYRLNLDELIRLAGGTSCTSPKSISRSLESGTRIARPSEKCYDLIALVNPNSPTGQHVPREQMEKLLQQIPEATRIWIDETYIEFAGPDQSLERFAASSKNVVVCKSMSKVYALSGARAAYLCGPAEMLEELRAMTPPWAVSLPAQIAAVAALHDPDYYAGCYRETNRLREQLAGELSRFEGWGVLPGIANFVLCHLPQDGPDAAMLVKHCRAENIFLRNADAMGRCFAGRAVRIAVKDSDTNQRMLEILQRVNNRLPTLALL